MIVETIAFVIIRTTFHLSCRTHLAVLPQQRLSDSRPPRISIRERVAEDRQERRQLMVAFTAMPIDMANENGEFSCFCQCYLMLLIINGSLPAITSASDTTAGAMETATTHRMDSTESVSRETVIETEATVGRIKEGMTSLD